VAGLKGIAAVGVDNDGSFIGDGGLEFLDADVRVFAGVERHSTENDGKEDEEFLHGIFVDWI
jgi:hypothetical protein